MKAVPSIPPPALAASRAAPRPGQIIGERYRLEEWLERGAMGSVWRAKQIRLRSPAAIKFLDPSLIEVPEMLERFLQEARSAAAVQSAHVIQVFDYGSEEGLPYIAMEFLEGENLASRLALRGVLTPTQLDKIFSELARGIGQAHALGVIHRDLKPANIFLAREGKHEVTKLIDFGIAKVKADALRVSQVIGTELGVVLGTPQYMSPEQLRGWSTLDHRTDLWALGVIACECLTGCCPFPGTTLGDLTVQICTEEPLTPSSLGNVPAGFDQWFFKATRKEPSERFESVAEMADALSSILVPGRRSSASLRRETAASGAPSTRDLRAAWAAASSRVMTLSGLTFERAAARAAGYASLLRSKASSLTQAVALPFLRRAAAWRWSSIAVVGSALLVLAASSLLATRQGGPSAASDPVGSPVSAAAAPAAAPSRAVQAALPGAPQSSAPRTAPPARLAPAPDPLTHSTLPVLNAEELPLVAALEDPTARAPSTPAKAPEARRPGKKPTPPAVSSDDSASTPSSPMSEAMVRIGALIAQGGNKGAQGGDKGAQGGNKGAQGGNKGAQGGNKGRPARSGGASDSAAQKADRKAKK